MKFTKMHGTGNDYVYVNCLREKVEDPAGTARKLSDRHFGIGADGLILILPSERADFGMDIYNADGSRAEMCGNGIRCLGKYVYDIGLTRETHLRIETLSGIRELELLPEGNEITNVRVQMGKPNVRVHNRTIQAEGKNYDVTGIVMGNPHIVLFTEDVKKADVKRTGMALEHYKGFQDGANVEFVHVADRKTIEMRVWERGSGETLSCGTGACAAAVACMLNRLTDAEVTIKLLGGDLQAAWNRMTNQVYLTGPAKKVFDGEIYL